MAHDIILDEKLNKTEKYEFAAKQLAALTDYETNIVANLANTSALLKEVFGWFWIGFYLVDKTTDRDKQELVLSAFQGSVACTRIRYGNGVCGSAWKEGKSLVVDNVEAFAGHIACSSLSRSEIVVPIFNNGKVIGVLDVDSTELATFDEQDRVGLEKIVEIVSNFISR